MPVPLSSDERRLAFEARRLAVETLIKVYLEHVTHARHLVTAHLRLMFTLSLGALAGVVTLYGATLRVVRVSSRSLRRSSSPLIVWLSADYDTPSLTPALAKLRSRATIAKAARSLKIGCAID